MEILLTNRKFNDLNPLIAGEEMCAPHHSFGPAVRNHTLIHYVLHGSGTFYARGEYTVYTQVRHFSSCRMR